MQLFKNSDEIIFAAGFLRQSGLNNIKSELKTFCNDKKKKSTFFIGTGLGETDPKTLEELHSIIKTKENHQLILCTPDAGIFHSKIYVFRKETTVTILIGSANLTEAGWVVNDEVSMLTQTSTHAADYLQLTHYLSHLHKSYYTKDILGLILKYKTQLEQFNQNHSKKPVFKFKRTQQAEILGIDLPMLRHYYESYKKSKEFIKPSTRENQYILARQNLDRLASDEPLDAVQFHDLFGPLVGHAGYEKLWHSGSIHRTTHITLQYADAFRELVRVVKDNSINTVDNAFSNVMHFLNTKRKSKEIFGIGENIMTEIMLSYNFQKFPNLNRNPLTVLSIAGSNFKAAGSFKGADYLQYTLLLTKIKDDLKMKSFLEIDSFFNYVYWIDN
ncbi:restriction endonuclease PLD domain-containing protein [Flavobacterium aquidurense]|uniref:restriction endonuclease PLD domain-containing protein n=1 Tax=Flavobacterium aquidurense TaxID=362413 RepID=UPI00285FE333|nr:restriction endonuclease PLD domain-containing protein [Flavobacterium aquidurense]MDR7371080.1 HKD family nuclease [Flavobacterium aquidurense]